KEEGKGQEEIVMPEITIDVVDSLVISKSGGKKTIQVPTESDWVVKTDEKWITFINDKGDKDHGNLEVSISENEGDKREGFITITGSLGNFSTSKRIKII